MCILTYASEAAKKAEAHRQASRQCAALKLIDIYRIRDPDHLDDAIEDAEQLGRSWKRLVQAGLRLVEYNP